MSSPRRSVTTVEVRPKQLNRYATRVWNSLRGAILALWKKSGEEEGVSEEISARLTAGTVENNLKKQKIEQLRVQAQREQANHAREEELFELQRKALALQNRKIAEEILKIRDERAMERLRLLREAGFEIAVRDFNGKTKIVVRDKLPRS